MVRSVLAFCLALSTVPQAYAQQLDVAAIDRVFEAYSRPNTPGCVLGVGRGNQVLYERGYGMANLEYDAPLSASTIVEIGSVSKQFTAGAVLLLAQRGVLSLDDDIRKWLPEVPDFGKKITIRMLANHTSGLRDQWGLLGLMNSPPGTAVHTPELVLDLVTRQRDLNFKPNEQYLYSNTNYTLLGIIVRRASGKSLAEFSREHIFGPLGMKDTQWRDDFTRVVKGRATAYSRSSNDQYRQEMPFTNVYGNGGLLTTVRDLITWWDALYNDKLGAGFLTQLTTSGVLDSQHKIGYALGISNGTYRGVRSFTHSGATAGYRAYLASYPDSKTTIAVLCNSATANTAQHVERVADLVLTQLAPPTTRTAVKAATDVDLNSFAGLYRDPNTEETFRFTVRDGRLTAGTIELVPTGPTSFQDVRRDAVVTVSRERGTTRLRTPASDVPYIELVQIPEAKPTAAQLQEYAGTYTSAELGIVYQVIPGDGNLVVKRRLQSDLTLVPTYADAFSNFGSWVFTRSSSGKVNGLLYSQGRVRRVRFDKANDVKP
jgi:CubicO group peptidase (beta-lactamase class C family)